MFEIDYEDKQTDDRDGNNGESEDNNQKRRLIISVFLDDCGSDVVAGDCGL